MRCLPLLTALAITAAAMPAMAREAAPSASETSRKDGADLRVGSELVALREVKLRDATLVKGSRVKVIQVTRKGGRLAAVDLELKDGHVLRAVDYRIVRDAFRPVGK